MNELYRDQEAENGWALVTTTSTSELVDDYFSGDLDDDLCRVVAASLEDDEWFDPGSLWFIGRELLSFSWQRFRSEAPIDPHAELPSGTGDEAADGIAPDAMLDRVIALVDSLGLIREWSPATSWFRAVALGPTEIRSARRIGTVPDGRAKANRMSPPGVGRFYGAVDAATAIAEIGPPPAGSVNVIGEWLPNRSVKVLDLTTLPAVPSLYDVDRSDEREAVLFLTEFAADVSVPVAPGAVPRVVTRLYRPTQMLVEHLALRLPSVDGIVYWSSRTGSPCCTLFVANHMCLERTEPTSPSLELSLRLMSAIQVP